MSDKISLPNFDRTAFDDTCARRFFFGPAFDAYGGTSGLFDQGPAFVAMKHNFIQQWRQHFVLEEQMCEIESPAVTPAEVFKASGHEQRFNDVMVRDTKTGLCLRLDKHIEEWASAKLTDKKTPATDKPKIEKLVRDVETLDEQQLAAAIKEFNITSMQGNPLSDPFPFNLMFRSDIGPEGTKHGYMRPELAQGIILNFKRLLDTSNAQRIPFAAASIGQAFRNEIAPRNSLLRVREFTLAEIEHFMNPDEKSHPRFAKVADQKILAWDQGQQERAEAPTERSISELLSSKAIDNETLAYYIGRTALFLEKIGVRHFRFRQHRKKEMAHYAQDCWDAECLTSFGWYECVGIADRSAYDLSCHIKATKKEMYGRVDYETPRMEMVLNRNIDKRAAGKAFGKEMGKFVDYVNQLSPADCHALEKELTDKGLQVVSVEGKEMTITRNLVSFVEKEEKKTGHNFVPSVVEPSFGVGRILYAILEQSYWVREDGSAKNDKRAVFSFPALLAPQKVAVFPLMQKPALEPKVTRIIQECVIAGISTRSDDSGGSIGKKYARVDELGIPFCVTVDFEEDEKVTLRHRDSAKQVRVPIGDIVSVLSALCKPVHPRSWASVEEEYPAQQTK